jgi:hypothetical protein
MLSRSLHSPMQLVCSGKGKHKKTATEVFFHRCAVSESFM